jgi:hypothetical protein
MEQKCLQHLDAPGSWEMLRTSSPERSDILGWSPFRRVFGFNLALFAIVFAGIFFGLEMSMEAGLAGIREDLPYGIGLVLVLSVSMAAYVTNLYRRSWNKRANEIRRPPEPDVTPVTPFTEGR